MEKRSISRDWFGNRNRFLAVLGFFCVTRANAQDIQKIVKGDVLSASGGLSLGQVFYQTNGPNVSRKPYSYLLNGNVNVKLLGFIDAPFLFFYSNLGSGFTQPTFNQTSFHPRYKWVETHFGNVTTSWSPFTLNGHALLGTVIDLKPGNWEYSLVYGRFMAARTGGVNTSGTMIQPAMKRLGGGIRILRNRPGTGTMGLNVFTARDVSNASTETNLLEVLVPKANTCFAVNSALRLKKRVQIKGEMAWSVWTEDLNENTAGITTRRNTGLFQSNNSTSLYKALKASADIPWRQNAISLGYERIDPGYRTMGAYYFNNDLENVTLGISSSVLKNKVRFQGNIGKQRDNLTGTKPGFMRRTVGNASVQYHHSEKINVQGNYSNFLSFTNLRAFNEYQNSTNYFQNWDTLNFRQVSQNMSLNGQIAFRRDTVLQQFLTANMVVQTAAERRGNTIQNGSLFANGVLSFGNVRVKTGTSLVLSLSVASIELNEIQSLSWSPALSFGTGFCRKRLKTTATVAITRTGGSLSASSILNLRNQWTCTLAKMHQVSLGVIVLRKDISGNHASTFRESTVTLNYSVNTTFFDVGRRKKDGAK